MSPDHRTPTTSGPLLRGKRRKIGGLATTALLVAIGLVTPAAAIAHTMTGHASAADGRCDKPGMGGWTSVGGRGRRSRPRPRPRPRRQRAATTSTQQFKG